MTTISAHVHNTDETGAAGESLQLDADRKVLGEIDRALESLALSRSHLADLAGLDASVISRAFTSVFAEDASPVSAGLRLKLLRASERLVSDASIREIRSCWPQVAKRRQRCVRVACPGTMASAPLILGKRLGLGCFRDDPLATYSIEIDWANGGHGPLSNAQDTIQAVADGKAEFGLASAPAFSDHISDALTHTELVPVALLYELGVPRLCVSTHALRHARLKRKETFLFQHLFDKPAETRHLFHSGTLTLRRFIRYVAEEVQVPWFCDLAFRYEKLRLGTWPSPDIVDQNRGVVFVGAWAPHTYEIIRRDLPFTELVRIPHVAPRGLSHFPEYGSPKVGRRFGKPEFTRDVDSPQDIYDACGTFRLSHVLFAKPADTVDNPSLAQSLVSAIGQACKVLRNIREEPWGSHRNILAEELWEMVSWPNRSADKHLESDAENEADAPNELPETFKEYVAQECSLMLPSITYHPEFVNRIISRVPTSVALPGERRSRS